MSIYGSSLCWTKNNHSCGLFQFIPFLIKFDYYLQARGLLDSYDDELVDPRLKASEYDPFEMHCMMHAARQCIKRDPSMRPRMTQVSFVLASSRTA